MDKINTAHCPKPRTYWTQVFDTSDQACKTVTIAATVLGLVYLLLTYLHLIFMVGLASKVMSFIAFVSALTVFSIALWCRRKKSRLISENALALIAVVVLVNCTAHIWAEQVFSNTINFVVYSLGLGFIITSSLWFYTLLTAGIFLWGTAVLALGLDSGGSELVWLWFFSQVISVLLHYQRRGSELHNRSLAETLNCYADALNLLVKAPELANSELDSMFTKIVKVASEVLEVDTVSIWSYDAERELIRCEQFFSQSGREIEKGIEITKAQGPDYFEAIKSYRVIDARDVLVDPRTRELREYLQSNSISSMMDLPIIIRGSLWGVICLEHKGECREWNLQEQSFGTSLADIAALTIQGHQNSVLERRSSQAERLESMGVLAGGVAHDFNNLLTVILGHTELVSLKSDSSAIKPNLEAILKASERAQELAQQMLAYSGRATFLAQEYELSSMVSEFKETWAQHLLRSVKLDFALSQDPLTVQGDITQIRQVITNLLTNARDAGATQITIKTGEASLASISNPLVDISDLESDQRFACVEVRDNGSGMTAEIRDKVFDPFFTTKSQGSGLGLAATLGIVRAHNGTIELESSPQSGSAFKIYLPRVEESQHPQANASAQVSKEELSPQDHLVVVEDEPDIASLACEFLGENFNQMSCYNSYSSASDAISEMNLNNVSVMLVDLSLGDGDGVELIHHVKEKRGDMPIVLMSGFDADEALSRLPEEHEVQFLHKPFTRQQILHCVEQVVETRKPS